MKATFDIPDELYREAKAKSALLGTPLRHVVIEMFHLWLHGRSTTSHEVSVSFSEEEEKEFPWLTIASKYPTQQRPHDMAVIRESIAKGWHLETGSNEENQAFDE